jgi:hypothetical protein
MQDHDPNSVQALAAEWLPAVQFWERHSLAPLFAEPAQIVEALAQFDTPDDPLLSLLLDIREAPARLFGHLGISNGLTQRPRFGLRDFMILTRSDTQLVFGLVGHFWRPDFGLVKLHSAAQFRDAANDAVAQRATRLVLVFAVTRLPEGGCRLTTGTGVWCPSLRTRCAFGSYWWLIRGFSGLIRRRILRHIKHRVEEAQCAG